MRPVWMHFLNLNCCCSITHNHCPELEDYIIIANLIIIMMAWVVHVQHFDVPVHEVHTTFNSLVVVHV